MWGLNVEVNFRGRRQEMVNPKIFRFSHSVRTEVDSDSGQDTVEIRSVKYILCLQGRYNMYKRLHKALGSRW